MFAIKIMDAVALHISAETRQLPLRFSQDAIMFEVEAPKHVPKHAIFGTSEKSPNPKFGNAESSSKNQSTGHSARGAFFCNRTLKSLHSLFSEVA